MFAISGGAARGSKVAGKVKFGILDPDRLARRPGQTVSGGFNSHRYRGRVMIPDYARRIEGHYAEVAADGLYKACAQAAIPFNFRHFGLLYEFEERTEVDLQDAEMVVDCDLRRAVAEYGPVVLRNVYLSAELRREFQRNIFQHLRFHYDRGPRQANQYSLFSRDPFDPVQAPPRCSSTLITANIVAYLQLARERRCNGAKERGVRASYDLFEREDMAPVLGNVVLEQPWDAPHGTGEIVVIDNRTVLHASYHRMPAVPGYPIGAKYLY